MLQDWQRIFPKAFEAFPTLLMQLTAKEQASLAKLLKSLAQRGVNLADESLLTDVLKSALSALSALSRGLDPALELFDLAQLNYNENHLKVFFVLTEVLANPLCRTIFDARLRCFSDYYTPVEPVSTAEAKDIIKQIYTLQDKEERIRTFFNFFAEFRPIPGSQAYLVNLNIDECVNRVFMRYCQAKIAGIENATEYLQVKNMIKTLRLSGGSPYHFQKIKYVVASYIESEDLCSMRHYDGLMEEIKNAVQKPQNNLDSFITELHQSKGYKELEGQALKTNSLFKRARPTENQTADYSAKKYRSRPESI